MNENLSETIKRPVVKNKPDRFMQHIRSIQKILTQNAFWYAVLGSFFLILYVSYGGRRSIWSDEAVSINLAEAPWHVVERFLWGVEVNMALYTLILRGWLWMINSLGIHATEVIVRFPSAVFGAITVVIVCAIGRKYIHPLAGWLAAIICGFSQTMLYYSQEARSYTLYTAAVALGYYFLFEALDWRQKKAGGQKTSRKSRWLWAGFTIAMAVAVNAHLIAVTFVMAQAVMYLLLLIVPNTWREEARKQVRWMVLSLGGIVALSLPILIDAAVHGSNNAWILAPSYQLLGETYRQDALGYDQTATYILYLYVVLGLVGVILAATWTFWQKQQPHPSSVLARVRIPDLSGAAISLVSWFILPSLVAFYLSRRPLDQHLFLFRYQMAAFVAAFLLVGLLLAIIPWNLARIPLFIFPLLFVAGNWTTFDTVNLVGGYTPFVAYNGFKPGMNWLVEHYQPGDGIVCVTGDMECAGVIHYYLHNVWPNLNTDFDTSAPGGFDKENIDGRSVNADLIEQYALHHKRLFVVNNSYRTGLSNPLIPFIAQQYTFLGEFDTSTVVVQLYQVQT